MTNKNVKVVLDLTILNRHDILIEEMLSLIAIKYPEYNENFNPELFEILVLKGLLKFEGFKPIITTKGNLMVSLSTSSGEMKGVIKRSIVKEEITFSEGFIERYRNKFKNLKPGSMGYPKGVLDKMIRFFRENPGVTEDSVLKATERYLKTLDSYTYLQRADYFIYKMEKGGESSRLSIFVEEVRNGGSEDPDGWLTNLV